MGCVVQSTILGGVKGAVVRAPTMSATEGTGGATESTIGMPGVSRLPWIPEDRLCLAGFHL